MFTCGNLNNDNHDLHSKFCREHDEWVFQCAFRYRSRITDGEAWGMPSYQTSDTLLSQLLGLFLLDVVESILFVKFFQRCSNLCEKFFIFVARFWSLCLLMIRIHSRISFDPASSILLMMFISACFRWWCHVHKGTIYQRAPDPRIVHKTRLQERRFILVLTSNQSIPNTITYV